MKKKTPNKICILVDVLAFGGAEKAAGVLSQLLHNKGLDVLIISLKKHVSYHYSGKLINLGIKHSKFKILKQFQKTLGLKKAIKTFQPDVIIDFRMRNRFLMEFVLHQYILKNENVIYTIHSAFKKYQMPTHNYFEAIYKKATLVAVSKEITNQLLKEGFTNTVCIPNTINTNHIAKNAKAHDVNERYIVAVGRLLNETKQFDKLIETYKKSDLLHKNIKLFILGEGKDEQTLKRLIDNLQLESHVKLLGFKNNPYSYIKNALFTVLCSKVEGLPMVILESLALKTPVVAFNCVSGPKEMIAHNENGILVENQNWDALLLEINRLANNQALIEALTINTDLYLEPFKEETHLNKWIEVINGNLNY